MIKEPVHIDENSISIGQYLRYAMSAYMRVWWWAYALPLLSCLALSVMNVNFLFVAVVLLFLVFIMLLFIVVVYYGIVPESRFSTMVKDMELRDDGVFLKLKKRVEKENAPESSDGNEEDIPLYEIEETIIPWNDFTKIVPKDECMLLMFVRPRYSFLAIPYSAFEDEQHMRDALTVLRSRIR